MGWSCAADASKVLNKWSEACRKQTNTSNIYIVKGKQYFFDVSRIEHDDGAITGTIFLMHGNFAYRKSGFRIEPDGRVSKAHKFLKDAANETP